MAGITTLENGGHFFMKGSNKSTPSYLLKRYKKYKQNYIEALFIIFQHLKKNKCLTTVEWLKQKVIYSFNRIVLRNKSSRTQIFMQHE